MSSNEEGFGSPSNPGASRREFLAVAALWSQAVAAAQHNHQAAQAASTNVTYRFAFFQPDERQTLNRLAAILIPADERSGGATAAHVDEYIDFVVSHGNADLKKRWRDGLAPFAKLDAAASEQRLRELAANEFAPKSAGDQFFILLKGAVAEGFYTSEEGIRKELAYQGLGFLREFPGCTHESHAIPEGYQPRLKMRT
jgi:hypothetical protein